MAIVGHPSTIFRPYRMHIHFLDPYRPRVSLIHQLDPRVKLVLALAFILTTSLAPFGAWPIYILLFALAMSIVIASELGVGYVLKRAALAIPFVLTAVATPGHAPDHLCFALDGTGILFSGDHVMGWSTSVVLPPEGSILDYVASLDRLIARADRLLLPGHGGPIDDPVPWLRGLKAHRKMRGAAILARLKAGDRSVDELAASLYRGLGAERAGAARGMIAAHLAALAARGLVRVTEAAADGTPVRVAPAP